MLATTNQCLKGTLLNIAKKAAYQNRIISALQNVSNSYNNFHTNHLNLSVKFWARVKYNNNAEKTSNWWLNETQSLTFCCFIFIVFDSDASSLNEDDIW